MLSLIEPGPSRREFLRIGGLGLGYGGLAFGGLGLSTLLAGRAAAAKAGRPVTDKSVVFLFLHGGPAQTEMFDPKMTAPSGVRSATGEIGTSLPGVTFGTTLQRLAPLAHRMAVVRSFTTGNGNHDIKPIVGRDTLGANLGSVYARVAGTTYPATGMPRNVALFPRAVDPSTQTRNMNFGKFDSTGTLGRAYAPFIPGGGSHLEDDMTLKIARGRLDDRLHLLRNLDRLKKEVDSTGTFEGIERFRGQALDVVLGGISDAFDLSKEDPRTLARYDTSGLVREENISKKWNNHKNYLDHAKTLGKLLLLSRRLCERGCGFVTVTTNFVWDMHADQNNATMEEGMRYCGLPFDHAVSAFLEDLEERGLSEQILLVACGEMGRTPKINKRGGRDHWGRLAPLMLAGGGLNMGQVIGQSTPDAGEPASEPITSKHLVATVLRTLFDVGELRVTQGIPGELIELADAEPIPGLL